MYIHVPYLYNSIHVTTSQTRWFIDVHVVQKTTPRIGWGEELLVILIVGGKKTNGFPAAIFPHESLEQRNLSVSKKPLKSIQDILRWFEDTFEDTFGAYPKSIQHLQSKDSFHKASMACWGRISLSSLKPWSNRLRWVLPMVVTPVKANWMKPRKNLSNMFSTGGRCIYICIYMGVSENVVHP